VSTAVNSNCEQRGALALGKLGDHLERAAHLFVLFEDRVGAERHVGRFD
jgi:hypothetical protein